MQLETCEFFFASFLCSNLPTLFPSIFYFYGDDWGLRHQKMRTLQTQRYSKYISYDSFFSNFIKTSENITSTLINLCSRIVQCVQIRWRWVLVLLLESRALTFWVDWFFPSLVALSSVGLLTVRVIEKGKKGWVYCMVICKFKKIENHFCAVDQCRSNRRSNFSH